MSDSKRNAHLRKLALFVLRDLKAQSKEAGGLSLFEPFGSSMPEWEIAKIVDYPWPKEPEDYLEKDSRAAKRFDRESERAMAYCRKLEDDLPAYMLKVWKGLPDV